MGAARGVVRVRRDVLAARMTCPLCQGLLREATAITHCLHTCESSLPPSRPPALSLCPVRSCSLAPPVSSRAGLGGGHGFPAPPRRGCSSPRAVSRRVAFVCFGFGVEFCSFSRSDASGDRAGVRCEFFDPRRVANAPPFSWIVALVPRPRMSARGVHLAPRSRLLSRGPRRCRSSGAGFSCPASL
jgi:hypothetical protein